MTKTVLPRKIILVLFLYLVFIPQHDNVFSAVINCQPGAQLVYVCVGFGGMVRRVVMVERGPTTEQLYMYIPNDATTVILFNGSDAL